MDSDAGRALKAIFERRKYKYLEEEVKDFASKKDITANDGLEISYSNVGMNIAGRILEVITLRSFEQLMQERITRPL
ncbi:serine hydrolase, partial [Escherichia coli]|uniref:serine hydrolase n=1 Tax=Escherichia coli TaxID=562 RepID=UPI00339D3424